MIEIALTWQEMEDRADQVAAKIFFWKEKC